MKKLRELIEKERDLAHTKSIDGSYHTLEEFRILAAKKELCDKFLKFIRDTRNKCVHPLPVGCEENIGGICQHETIPEYCQGMKNKMEKEEEE